jgi:hypothetical protein
MIDESHETSALSPFGYICLNNCMPLKAKSLPGSDIFLPPTAWGSLPKQCAARRAILTISTVAMPSFVVPRSDPSDSSVNRFSCVLAIVVMKFCGAHSEKNGMEE